MRTHLSRATAVGAGLALLLLSAAACSSGPTTADTVTVTAPTTVQRSVPVTATRTATAVTTRSVSTTVRRAPDRADSIGCAAVGAGLGAAGLLEPLQKWSAGGGLTVIELTGGIVRFTPISAQGAILTPLTRSLNSAATAFRDASGTQLKTAAEAFVQAWDAVSDACAGNGSAIPAVKVVRATVTATTTVSVGQDGAPATSIDNGDYLVPGQIRPGVYQCSSGDNPYWESLDKAGEIIDNGLSSIARVPADAYSMTLNRCSTAWVKVG